MSIMDTQRLDFLQSILKGKAICRNSTRGRGFRLHQTRNSKHMNRAFTDIRKAIDNYMDIYPTEKKMLL